MNILQKIADYIANEYDGNDENSKPMKITIHDMRFICRMHNELCALRRFKEEIDKGEFQVGDGLYGKI